jgi:membrane protein YqaA with SNARE-associated domain
VRTLYLAVSLSYLVTGFIVAIVFVYIFRRRFMGHFWAAALVAVIGAFIGGVVEYLLADLIRMLSSINGVFNVFPPIIAASVFLTIFAHLSEHKDDYGD